MPSAGDRRQLAGLLDYLHPVGPFPLTPVNTRTSTCCVTRHVMASALPAWIPVLAYGRILTRVTGRAEEETHSECAFQLYWSVPAAITSSTYRKIRRCLPRKGTFPEDRQCWQRDTSLPTRPSTAMAPPGIHSVTGLGRTTDCVFHRPGDKIEMIH